MDKKLRMYIKALLNESRERRLDELDEALTDKNASREFVELKLGAYRDTLVATLMFADYEDSLGTASCK